MSQACGFRRIPTALWPRLRIVHIPASVTTFAGVSWQTFQGQVVDEIGVDYFSKPLSTTATEIRDINEHVVTAVEVGSRVHDVVTVSGDTGSPVPTGSVNIDWFANGSCTGRPNSNSGPMPLNGIGQAARVSAAADWCWRLRVQGPLPGRRDPRRLGRAV